MRKGDLVHFYNEDMFEAPWVLEEVDDEMDAGSKGIARNPSTQDVRQIEGQGNFGVGLPERFKGPLAYMIEPHPDNLPETARKLQAELKERQIRLVYKNRRADQAEMVSENSFETLWAVVHTEEGADLSVDLTEGCVKEGKPSVEECWSEFQVDGERVPGMHYWGDFIVFGDSPPGVGVKPGEQDPRVGEFPYEKYE
jgi:hypothetical protein